MFQYLKSESYYLDEIDCIVKIIFHHNSQML